jgi:hypothetical protein
MMERFVGLEDRRGYSVIVPAWPKLSKELIVVTATRIGPIAFMVLLSFREFERSASSRGSSKTLSAATKGKTAEQFRY